MQAVIRSSVVAGFVALLIGLSALPSQGALVAADDFETGNFSGGSGWSAVSWTTAGPTSVVNASLNYAAGNVSSNGGTKAAQYLADGTGTSPYLNRTVASTTLPIYYSFLIQYAVIGTDTNDFFGVYPQRTGIAEGDADNYGGVLRANAGNQNFGVRSDDGGGQVFVTSVNATTSSVHLVVLKLENVGGTDSMTIWVDPDSTSELGGTNASRLASDSGGTRYVPPNDNFFTELNFRTANTESGDTYLIDNVRVGTSWDSVVVPEPATLTLACFGCLALLGVARPRVRSANGGYK